MKNYFKTYAFISSTILLLVYSNLISGCKSNQKITNISETPKTVDSLKKSLPPQYNKSYTLEDYFLDNEHLDSLTKSIAAKLSESEKISQMIISSAGKYGRSKSELNDLIRSKIIGGVVFLGGEKEEIKSITNHYISLSDSLKTVPLLFSTDAEPSLINQKILGISKFNPTNTIKDVTQCEEISEKISNILSSLHITQNYAPVCDLNINKEIISDRSFSNKDSVIIKLASTFIKSSQSKNIIATAKHFPGHGNVKGDSHKEPVSINGELKELSIFKNAIDSGVISIMVGHIIIQDNPKYSTDNLPSTLSSKILKSLLREELGFKGLIVTDAMNMEAVKKFKSPGLNAAIAGCDLILMPTDERKLFSTILDEFKKNAEFKKQVEMSVYRIIRVKICLGLFDLTKPI